MPPAPSPSPLLRHRPHRGDWPLPAAFILIIMNRRRSFGYRSPATGLARCLEGVLLA